MQPIKVTSVSNAAATKLLTEGAFIMPYYCQHCGVLVSETYGSGKFCSRACANSRINSGPTEAFKAKKQAENEAKYLENPHKCKFCGKPLQYSRRYRNTCSSECAKARIRKLDKSHEEIKGKNVSGRHIVYKVINDFDSRYYIGVRKTEKADFDGYLGSGIHIRRMVKHYGKEHFSRLTLFEFNNSDDAYEKEKELLKEALSDPNCVNLAKGGQGGCTFLGRHHSDATKKLLSEIQLAKNKANKIDH